MLLTIVWIIMPFADDCQKVNPWSPERQCHERHIGLYENTNRLQFIKENQYFYLCGIMYIWHHSQVINRPGKSPHPTHIPQSNRYSSSWREWWHSSSFLFVHSFLALLWLQLQLTEYPLLHHLMSLTLSKYVPQFASMKWISCIMSASNTQILTCLLSVVWDRLAEATMVVDLQMHTFLQQDQLVRVKFA